MADNIRTLYQGQFLVSRDPNDCIVTVLGSCIAACVYDPVAKVGGANHFLVAHGPKDSEHNLRYGLHAMELLINGLLKEGADRKRLVAKVFGGAKMFDEMTDIGRMNSEFALGFLDDEGIPCLSQSTLGRHARRLRFWPATGRAQQRIVDANEVAAEDRTPVSTTKTTGSEVLLFGT